MLTHSLMADIVEKQVQYSHWFTFWISILLIALAIFTIIACIVTVKGWFEMKTMFVRLSQLNGDDKSDDIAS